MVFANQLKTVVLLSALVGFFMWIGYLLGGYSGLIIAFIISMIFNFFTYWYSDKIVLKMYGAKKVSKNSNLYHIVRELSHRAKLPVPKVYIIPIETPNAFATGRNYKNSAVAVTEGLLSILNENELKGVIAHELSHIKNRDTLIQTFVVTVASAISMIANILQWALIFGIGRDEDDGLPSLISSLLIIILAPIIAAIIQFAISRSREYMADEGSARITHNPDFLISALVKLEKGVKVHPFTDPTKSQTSSLFIINPFSGRSLFKLFSTHPSTKDRIKRLKKLKL